MNSKEIINKRLLFSERPDNMDYIDRRDNSLVFRTFSQEEEKLVMQIRTSDANRAAAESRKMENYVNVMGCLKCFSLKGDRHLKSRLRYDL